jgi:hypothetical protein
MTGAQLFAPFFTLASASPLKGVGNTANAPASDMINTSRAIPPSIGAYE